MRRLSTIAGGCRALAIALCLAAWTCTAQAAELTFTCPAAGFAPELTLELHGNVLRVSDADATADLVAVVNGDPSGIFTIAATGPMLAPMPPLPDLERCTSGKLADQGAPASDTDALAYTLNLCRLQLLPTATPQSIEASYTITSLTPGSATALISRTYVTTSPLTGQPLRLDEWPMRQCVATAQP